MEEDGPEDSLGLPEIRIRKRVEKKGHRTKSEESQLGLCFVFITHCIPRAWQPTPVFLLGESHGQRSLVGYSP